MTTGAQSTTQCRVATPRVASSHLRAGLLLLPWFFSAAAFAQGAVLGQFSVTPSGAASYSLSIKAPPGVAGLTPQMAISYSSSGGAGLAGMGADIDGFSSITRCARTMLQDGARGAVAYDSGDRFCLDGQRLILVSGTYGAAGSEYRTEREDYSKITAYGTAGSGPSYFIAKKKNGSVLEFGNTADSRIEAQGKTSVRVWAIDKATDVLGNYMSYVYYEDTANGEYYPTRVNYTGRDGGAAPANSIQLAYETRPDATMAYEAGSLIKSTVRIKSIASYSGSTLVFKYDLTYAAGAGETRPKLTQIKQCGSTTCLPAISLGYGVPATTWIEQPALAPPHPIYTRTLDDEGTQFVDVNGDGLPDLVRNLSASNTTYKSAWLNTGTGWQEAPQYAPPYDLFWRTHDHEGIQFIDVNGDGLVDMVRNLYAGGSYYKTAWLNTGNGWQEAPQYAPPYPIFNRETGDGEGMQFVDLNGDGLVDIMRFLQVNGTNYKTAWLNTGSGWVEAPQYAPPYPLYTRNLDGEGMMLVDVNGDGLVDIVRHLSVNGTSYKTAWLNTGNGWVEAPQFAPPYPVYTRSVGTEGMQFVDVNGDGLVDIVRFLQANGTNYKTAWLNTGNGWVEAPQFAPPYSIDSRGLDNEGIQSIDIDGDGKSDYVRHLSVNGTSYKTVWSRPAGVVTLTSVTNGMETYTIQYLPLINPQVYTPDTVGGTNIYNLKTGGYVVRQVDHSNGVGGNSSVAYTYGGMKSELGTSGRGLLGFQWVQTKDVATGLVSRTYYRQDFPYIGMVDKAGRGTTDASWSNLALSTNEYSFKAFIATDTSYASPVSCTDTQSDLATCKANAIKPGNRYIAYPSKVVEKSWDWNDQTNVFTALPQKRTSTVLNNWADPTQIRVEVLDANGAATGFSKTTDTVYSTPDVANWKLGRVIKSSVTAVSP